MIADRWPLTCRPPRDELAADETLLAATLAGGPPAARWYVVDRPAIVLGFAQRARVAALVDLDRCRAAGVDVVERHAGGGLVLLDADMLCLTVALPLPHPLAGDDLTASYRWLGEGLAVGLRRLGVAGAERVEVARARAQAARLTGLPRDLCYAGLSPHEVAVGGAKLVGLAQVRRRQGALYQVGLLLRDQSRLADLVRVDDEAERAALRGELAARTVGLDRLLAPPPPPAALAEALQRELVATLD